MRIGTLFSGGLATPEQALKQMGKAHEVVFACEYDKFARQNYKANHPIEDEHFHIDVNDMDGKQYNGKVDVIVGGSPCQDFSIAGLREGIDGKRGQLIWQYYRIIMEASPEIFIYENVKGMMSDKGGKTINDFLQVFRESGYYCHHTVLNTKDYGVPQNRERVYIVGFKDAELYHRFQFADKVKLEKRLKDVLESEVDEKYYLSEEMVKGFVPKGNGEGYINQDTQASSVFSTEKESPSLCAGTHGYAQGYIQDINRVNRTLRCGGGSSMSDKHCFDLIQVKSATSRGYETATTGDSINLTHPDSETRRGRVGVGVGVAQTLDCACNQAVIEKEKDLEDDKIKTNTNKELRILWREAREKTFTEWRPGVYDPLQQKKILQSRLYGEEFCDEGDERTRLLVSARYCEKDKETFYKERLLREMWNNWKDGYTSHRRGLSKQLIIELDDIVQKLSHESTQAKADLQNRRMLDESEGARVLREALSEIQKMGESNDGQEAEKRDYRIRKLTVREVFRLQGCDDTFKIAVSNSQAYKIAGNAMSVNILEMIFNQIDRAKANEPTNTLMDFLNE